MPFDARVPPEIMLRMFAGVGVLVSEDHFLSDPLYNNEVITQTLEGTAAYTVSDETVIFGINSPADNLIVDDSVVEGRSIATIFQLLARVGRPGLSWTAYGYIGDALKEVLKGYLTGGRIGKVPFEPEAGIMNAALEAVLAPPPLPPLPNPKSDGPAVRLVMVVGGKEFKVKDLPAPAPVANSNGITPNTKVNEVIRIGRKRTCPAS